MSLWLEPVQHALDACATPVTIFCRDDDVGWEDEALWRLLDLFALYEIPLDMAVIPSALTPGLARQLTDRMAAAPGQLGVHQHGWTHVNHESTGRKCEFGPERPAIAQRQDIALGWQCLHDLLGPVVDPIFTPPWNRCTAVTGDCLVDLGFRALSRDATAAPLEQARLCELPVRVDWFARRKGVRVPRQEWGTLLATALTTPGPVGIMFHHAVMDATERQAARELLALLAIHDRARCCRMLPLVVEMFPEHS